VVVLALDVVRVAEPVTDADTVVDPVRETLPVADTEALPEAETVRLTVLEVTELEGLGTVAARRVALYTDNVELEPQSSPEAPVQGDAQKLSPSNV
jgi:hypothetical protein